jgi:hypothetical protein
MSVKVSFEIVNFEKELKRVEREVKSIANNNIAKKIDFATDTLRIVTPVDTGKARSGWKSRKYFNKNKFSEGSIINDVEYISILNNGHSRQAPKFFIEQVLTKIGILIPS